MSIIKKAGVVLASAVLGVAALSAPAAAADPPPQPKPATTIQGSGWAIL